MTSLTSSTMTSLTSSTMTSLTSSTMTSLHPLLRHHYTLYYNVTTPSTITSLHPLLWRHYFLYYDVTITLLCRPTMASVINLSTKTYPRNPGYWYPRNPGYWYPRNPGYWYPRNPDLRTPGYWYPRTPTTYVSQLHCLAILSVCIAVLVLVERARILQWNVFWVCPMLRYKRGLYYDIKEGSTTI